ncbi:hypothetical protein CJF42_08980 [Pseudoalteromonas sp. NBT06-2]|uniref:STAS domain-containing protein n=1 Tax=Pseudoalteromonas sp. NBT06-2 TaxID=2025950 RepID=UPI000BA65D1E|nr:STAS domain-containing protein [Pseudoalteromonas sp. NBT06-2]PAJ74688.1 hypothetical protein CJF42_08980 [Pseudoalteromonas sp. NBT06-2]
MTSYQELGKIFSKNNREIITLWLNEITTKINSERITEEKDCKLLIECIEECFLVPPTDLLGVEEQVYNSEQFKRLKKELQSFAAYRALNGYTPTQTANYLLTFKKIIYDLIYQKHSDTSPRTIIDFNNFIDYLVVISFQFYTDSRDEIINSQAYALEHDTPIVKISKKTLLMPLMGIIDTIKAQKIIEGLLEAAVEHQAEFVIVDMTAVPTFDTHVANNILKTILAAKMVGTQVILSGISPDAALTIVKLGVDLGHVETFNTLENAIAYSIKS